MPAPAAKAPAAINDRPRSRVVLVSGTALTVAGAVLMEWSGALHLYLWAHGYRTIATIGPLFLLQGLSGVLGAPVMAWWRRSLTTLAGSGYLATTAAGLLFSTRYGFFGFHESLSAPYARTSLWVEVIGAVILAGAGLAYRVAAGPTEAGPVSAGGIRGLLAGRGERHPR